MDPILFGGFSFSKKRLPTCKTPHIVLVEEFRSLGGYSVWDHGPEKSYCCPTNTQLVQFKKMVGSQGSLHFNFGDDESTKWTKEYKID